MMLKLWDDLRNNLTHNLITSKLFIGSSAISDKAWVMAWIFLEIECLYFFLLSIQQDLLCRMCRLILWDVYWVRLKTHPSVFYVDPGYRAIGGRTGKWGSSSWEKTLPICTTTTLLGWETVLHKPSHEKLALLLITGLPRPFLLCTLCLHPPSSFSSPSSTFSNPFLLQTSETLGFEASRISGGGRKYHYMVIYLINTT